MSTYNIREKFIYALATSSIEYIRNYNFNTSTITDIPLALGNTDTEIPITVNITTTVPWIQIVNPTTGANLKFPSGNVVLGPTSTSVVLVKVDLPPEIENVPSSSIYPDISLDIKSGSFPIISPPATTGSQSDNKNTITVPQSTYTIDPGERVQVDITVYDVDGDYNPYTPRIIRGISSGETTVTITAGPERETSITFIVRETSAGGPPPPPPPPPPSSVVD